MSDITISYKGSSIATMDATGTKTLLTEGKYCEDDITVDYVKPSGGGTDFVDLVARTQTAIENSDIVTVGNSAFREYTTLTSIILPNCESISNASFYGCSSLATIQLYKVKSITGSNCFNAAGTTSSVLVLPELRTYPNVNALNSFRGQMIDLGAYIGGINTYMFNGDTNLKTLILRKNTIPTLSSVNAFNNTPFKSGGSGGTIYIPKTLYDHLGDGTSSDYQSASNWSTVYGYGTITWAKIEGSIYETQYADGTAIPSS